MILSQRIFLINGLTLFCLYSICLLGDCLCFGRPFPFYILSNYYLRALTDNFTHGLISLFATSFLFGWTRRDLLIISFIAGSFVDIDHFIEVRSLSLYRALHDQPQGRPFLHNSLLLLIINLIIFGFEHFLWQYNHFYYSIILFLGWSTHHLRDAQRHGLTFSPLGQTSPIDYYIPIMCIVLLGMKLFGMFVFTTQSTLKTLILHNLYLIQYFANTIYSIEHLRSIWFEDCLNIHFLLSIIDKQHLKTVVLRRSTCDRTILTKFFDKLDTLHYLDLGSLQIIKSSSQINKQINIPSKLKTCSLNNTFLQIYSFLPHLSLRSLELIDINLDLLSTIFNTFQSLKILCLFFTTENLSLSSIINYLQYSKLLIHLHVQSIDDAKGSLPSNILILPLKDSFSCFCYQNLI